MIKPFFVIDTNCFISANLLISSTSAKAFDKALLSGQIALSNEIFNEYTEVMYKGKLDRYLNEEKRQKALTLIYKNSIRFDPTEIVTDCRDPNDNKFLELAITCQASCIISGDVDLLVLHPFRGIPILTPANFLLIF